MKSKVVVVATLIILMAIIYFADKILVRNKNVNTQSKTSVLQETQKSEKPCIQSFEAPDHEGTGRHALDSFLESILLQKSSHNIFGSTVTYTAENISGINKTRLPDSPMAIKTPDVLIMLMVVFMIFFFMTKVF